MMHTAEIRPMSGKGLTPKEIFTRLQAGCGAEAVLGFFDPKEAVDLKRGGDPFILVAPASITQVCRYLRENPDLYFDSLMSLGAMDEGAEDKRLAAEEAAKLSVDYFAPSFTVAYFLHSFKHRHKVHLHVKLPKEKPQVKTVESIWSAANWFERECFDLFGIEFLGHSDLRRLLLPDDWKGFPLRKDYEFPLEYNGIECLRSKLK